MTDTSFFEQLEERRRNALPPPDFGPTNTNIDSIVNDPNRLAQQQSELSQITGDATRSFSERLAAQRQLMEMGTIENNPLQTDQERRRSFLAQQVGQEFLGQPGLDETLFRADLGLSDTFEEQRLKFLDKFPDGDFVFVPRVPEEVSASGRGPTILFRRSSSEQFAELDARVLERVEILGDIADMSGAAPGMALEAVAALLTRGASLAMQSMAIFAANVTGELLKEGVEELRGFQLESPGTVVGRAGMEAGIATLTGGAADIIIGGPLRFARGSAFLTLRPGAQAAQASAEALGIDRLLPTQVANSPIIRKIGNQLAGTTQSVNDWVVNQHNQAVSALVRLRRPDLARLLSDDPAVLTEMHQEAIDQVVTAARHGEPSLSVTGTGLGQGIVEYDELASTLINRQYDNARRIETPTFDTATAKAVANDVLTGTQVERAAGGAAMRADPIDPRVQTIAEQIRDANPNLPTTNAGTLQEADAVAQLRAWRSQLWDLKTPNPGELFRQQHRDAARLFSAVDQVLKDPTNASPAFLSAWTRANELARGRFDTLEKIIITQAGKTEVPAQLARKLIQPDQVDNLRLLRDTMRDSPEGARKWDQFRAGARGFFLEDRNIHNLNNLLDTFDDDTLNIIMNRAEVRDLRRIADQVERIDAIDLPGIARRQSDAGEAIREAVRNGNTRQISDLVDLVKGLRPDDARRLDIRAGMMENIYRDVVNAELGFSVVDADRLAATLTELRTSGAIDLLTPDDIRVLENLETVAPWLPSVGDMGASLEAASVAATGRGLPRALVTGDAQTVFNFTGEMVELLGLGNMFTSKTFQRIALGKADAASRIQQFTSLRLFGAIAGDVGQNLGVKEPEE